MLTSEPGHAPIAVLTGPASAAMGAAPPALPAETPLGQAITAMAAARASALMVVDGAKGVEERTIASAAVTVKRCRVCSRASGASTQANMTTGLNGLAST